MIAVNTNYISPLDRRYRGEHPLRTIWYLLTGNKIKLIGVAILFLIKHSPVWALPLLTANIIDVVVERKSIEELWINAVWILALLAQNVPMNYWYAKYLSQIIRSVELNLRSSMTQQLHRLSMDYYKRVSAGVLHSKMVRDVEAVEQMLRQFFDSGASAFSNLLGGIIITGLRTPNFLLFYFLVIPISSFISVKFRRILFSKNSEFREKIEGMASRMSDMTHLIPITRAHALEESEASRMDHAFLQIRNAGVALDLGNALFGSLIWVAFNLFNAFCLVYAAWMSYSGIGGISPGDVVMVTTYFTSISSAILAFVSLTPVIIRGFESVRSIGEVLESPDIEQNDGKFLLNNFSGRFEFENVSFAYPDGHESALENITLTIAPGETVALVGPSGSGKSTVLNLVIGYIRPTRGKIIVDGHNMAELDLRSFRKWLSIVPQETMLFDGTIRENIIYGLENIPDTKIIEVLKDANAWEFVNDLPSGINALIGERGARLSGGQKQRLAIARALIREPKLLVLDEATSALDTESEGLVQRALERLLNGRTTFVVAHRLSTIMNADKIIVLEEGMIKEQGNHEELLKRNGLYAKLYRGQIEL